MNTPAYISDLFIKGIGTTLIHSIWQGLVVALLLAVVLYALPRKAAQLKYWMSVTALIAIVFWSGTTFNQQLFELSDNQLALVDGQVQVNLSVGQLTEIYRTENLMSLINGIPEKIESYMYSLVTIWIVGVVFFLLRLQGSMIYLHRLRTTGIQSVPLIWQRKIKHMSQRLGIKSSIEIVESRVAEIPMVIGHLKPMILLPMGMLTGLQTHEVEAILAHELAHIKRFDYIINIAQTVIESVLFFNPAIWWVSRMIRKQREHCCDDIAVKCCGNQLVYASALTNLGAWSLRTPTLGMGLFKNQNELLMRIKRLIYPEGTNRSVKEKLVPGVVLIATLLCLSWYSHRVQAELMPIEYKTISNSGFAEDISLPLQVRDTVPATPSIEEFEELPPKPPLVDEDLVVEDFELELDELIDIDIDVPVELEIPMEVEMFISPNVEEFMVHSQFPDIDVFVDPDDFMSSDFYLDPDDFIDINELVDMDQMKVIIKKVQSQLNDTTRERIRKALEQQRKALERARIEQAEALEKAQEQLKESLMADRPEELTEEEWLMAKDQIRQAERQIEKAMRQSERTLEQALEEHEHQLRQHRFHARGNQDPQRIVRKHVERIRRDHDHAHRESRRIHRDTDHIRHGSFNRTGGKESKLRQLLFEDGLIDDFNADFSLEFRKDLIKVNGIKLGGDQKEKYRKFLDEIYGENSNGTITYSD